MYEQISYMQIKKTSMEMKMQLGNEKSVFEAGNLAVKMKKVKKSDASRPPAELLVVAPEAQGRYPVVLFCHGYCTQTSWYSQLLSHISSHGYIIVAPKLYQWLVICTKDETKTAANVTKWLPEGLEACLPEDVKPDLSKAAVMGHSRGGRTAFALALGQQHHAFKALVGLDPVAGPTPPAWVEPRILSHVPRSLDVGMPVAVVGTGLGSRGKGGGIIPPLAPDGCNHSEFFNESRPPCCYFMAKEYGHCDVLDDEGKGLGMACRSGKGCKEKMRRGVGGVVVSFLHAYLGGDCRILDGVVAAPDVAPILLDPVIYVKQ